jgi:hypothetical protein
VHFTLDDQPFGERAAVVRAGCGRRQDLTLALDQHDRLLTDMAEQRLIVLELIGTDTFGKIRAGQFDRVAHG